jgi:hypothetical protein
VLVVAATPSLPFNPPPCHSQSLPALLAASEMPRPKGRSGRCDLVMGVLPTLTATYMWNSLTCHSDNVFQVECHAIPTESSEHVEFSFCHYIGGAPRQTGPADRGWIRGLKAEQSPQFRGLIDPRRACRGSYLSSLSNVDHLAMSLVAASWAPFPSFLHLVLLYFCR